jgi:hypothetical protein
MQLIKHSNPSQDVVPLLAALPYAVILEPGEDIREESSYDPTSQRTVYADGKRDYSTSREEDSAGGLLSSKPDTKKDD